MMRQSGPNPRPSAGSPGVPPQICRRQDQRGHCPDTGPSFSVNTPSGTGYSLPSMRNLAQQLRISIITTKRAYEELERDGFIDTFTGKGSFVSRQDQEFLREEGLRQIEQNLTLAVEKAKQCGVQLNELQDILKMLYE